jgi:predicted acetyltransferase
MADRELHRGPGVQLTRLGPGDRATLDRLGQLYMYDFSDIAELDVDRRGRFRGFDASFADDPGNDAWRFDVGRHTVGFALVAPDSEGWFVEDFFVLRRYRRRGVGTTAAGAVFATRAGSWGLSVRATNLAALSFWRRVLAVHAPEERPELGEDGNTRIFFRFIP